MKIRYLGILFLSILSIQARKTEQYYKFSYQYSPVTLNNINRTIFTYNHTRPWLSDKMDYCLSLQGGSIETGFDPSDSRFGLGFNVAFLLNRSKASGIEPASGKEGVSKIIINDFNAGINLKFKYILTKAFSAGVQTEFDYILFSVKRIYDNEGTREHDALTTSRKNLIGTTFSLPFELRMGSIAIEIAPYYQLPFRKVEVSYLMDVLQHVNSLAEYDSVNRYGLQCSLKLYFEK